MDVVVSLPDDVLDVIAERVADILEERSRNVIESDWYSSTEAAAYLRCSKQRVYDLVHDGRLTPRRDGRRLLFHRAELDGYLTRKEPA